MSFNLRTIAVMASQGDVSFCSLDGVIRGHHIYKSVWTPFIGEGLVLKREEPENIHDRYSVCVVKDGDAVVGHVPRELSKILWNFLRRGGQGTCEVTGPRKHGKGLEVPCTYNFEGNRRLISRLENLLEDSNSVNSCPY